jgi:hypothetical protein
MSGALNSKDDGTPRPGDVVIPAGYDLLIEAKLRATFQHHTLYREAAADAKKHGLTNTVLFTRSKGQRGYLAIVDNETFERILSVPGVRELFHARSLSEPDIHNL